MADRRGNAITVAGRRSLPGKANGPAHRRQAMPVPFGRHKRIGNPVMRHYTHGYVKVPGDTPKAGWL